MKILSIGNSFSEDAHRWLHDIAISNDYELDTVNLFIGGCSLETHWKNLGSKDPLYAMQGNGGLFIKNTTIRQALESEKYDVITLQQVSGLSGKFETYMPYINQIADFVKKAQPQSNIYFHRTWAYEINSKHPDFNEYNYDQEQMFTAICNASNKVSKIMGIEVIPVGDVIQALRRKSCKFNCNSGGLSLCRDGFHLSLDYGRFTAAAVWYKKLTGMGINTKNFLKMQPQFEIEILDEIMKHVEIYTR